MSDGSKIEWCDATWNVVRGCSVVSPGCTNCYAMKTAHRFNRPGGAYDGLTEVGNHGPRWTGKIRLVPEKLDEPLHWRKPRRVFVNSMSDLFHEDVPDQFIDKVFRAMGACDDQDRAHTFQILTKRPARMREYMGMRAYHAWNLCRLATERFPPSNVWLGASCENQKTADERIPLLLQTPAAVRFVSAEPLIAAVDLSYNAMCGPCGLGPPAPPKPKRPDHWTSGRASDGGRSLVRGIDWVIVGGESGPGARPCDVEWIRSIVEQCQEAQTPVFVKQLGARPKGWCRSLLIAGAIGHDVADFCDSYESGEGGHCGWRCVLLKDRKGGDPSEWPEDLRVREFPA